MAAANRRAEIAPFFRRPHRSSEKTANPFTKPDTMPKRPAVLFALLLAACGAAPADAPDETASPASAAETPASDQTASQ